MGTYTGKHPYEKNVEADVEASPGSRDDPGALVMTEKRSDGSPSAQVQVSLRRDPEAIETLITGIVSAARLKIVATDTPKGWKVVDESHHPLDGM